MDIIGKAYIDYFINSSNLDGNTHTILDYELGGLFNAFSGWEIDELFDFDYSPKLKVFCENYFKKAVKNKFKHLNIDFIETNIISPKAFIIENKKTRTSFVLGDEVIYNNDFRNSSEYACVFYGDKIKSNNFNHYSKLFLDTAGNDYKSLLDLSLNKNYPFNTIISISSEYLDKVLLKNFLLEDRFIVISHCPKSVDLYMNGSCIKLKNNFYISELLNGTKITGLGDKFIMLLSTYNCYLDLSLIQSIEKAQNKLSSFLK